MHRKEARRQMMLMNIDEPKLKGEESALVARVTDSEGDGRGGNKNLRVTIIKSRGNR